MTTDVVPVIRNRATKRGVSTTRVILHDTDIDVAVEPTRDWHVFRFVTGHRVRLVVGMFVMTSVLYMLQGYLWPESRYPSGAAQHTWSYMSLLWCAAIVPVTLGFIGMAAYRFPSDLDPVVRMTRTVSWRIVTRGNNIEALSATIHRCQTEMRRTPLFPYLIEVIIDEGPDMALLPQGDDVVYLVVPKNYRTENGSLFKARALQYALEQSDLADEAWIVHLDEETHPTSSGIKGICKMIREEEYSGRLRVGQGAILYHRDWRRHPILTLADMGRTGDDFARFYFQHRLGRTVFGLHGSYIVVRNDIEKLAGFDFGPEGSITEDAFWALVLMDKGVRARWCEGYLEEQSTRSLLDFLKQRRRWYLGLIKVARCAPVGLRWRIGLGANTLLWSLAPLVVAYTMVHTWYGFHVRDSVQLTANLSLAFFVMVYMVGLKANMDEHCFKRPLHRAFWMILLVPMMIIFCLMEAAGVIYAMARPDPGFHVVDK